ncbi:pre-peptidase C-terminal domain-containing protein [Vallitalea okinawensis]|uniref:pre-peptidase C-terminal domain-containing protein n=1 Tax=Vallitalea okinawensis TaxID=2078660 RepID=UPI000CFBB27F|nr:pre-peptidase C-terminal domain-containing protein [Vallitalea okinawensis]
MYILKKTLKMILSITLIFVAVIIPVEGSSYHEELSKDNTISEAIELDQVGNQYGKLSYFGDVDYYAYKPQHSGIANFWLDVPVDVNYDIEILDPKGSKLIGLYTNELGTNELITKFPVTGGEIYYIRIFSDTHYSTISDYLLRTVVYPEQDIYEENDSMESATSIRYNGGTITGNVNTPYDVDYYKVSVAENDSLNVHLWMPQNTDYDLDIYDVSGSLLESSLNSGSDSENITIGDESDKGLSEGTYYIKVYPKNKGQNSFSWTNYHLSVNVPIGKLAVTEWNYLKSDYSRGIKLSGEMKSRKPGSYTPPDGFMTARFYDVDEANWVKTYIGFTLDSDNVARIKSFNKGEIEDNWGDYRKAYFTLDVKSTTDGNQDQMSAYSIISNLPNPKYDLESDNSDLRNEEAEVVALGQVEAKYYDVVIYWKDYRTGQLDHSGGWKGQFSMSAYGYIPGLFPDISTDYNNYYQSELDQIILSYGQDGGEK